MREAWVTILWCRQFHDKYVTRNTRKYLEIPGIFLSLRREERVIFFGLAALTSDIHWKVKLCWIHFQRRRRMNAKTTTTTTNTMTMRNRITTTISGRGKRARGQGANSIALKLLGAWFRSFYRSCLEPSHLFWRFFGLSYGYSSSKTYPYQFNLIQLLYYAVFSTIELPLKILT